MRAYLTAALFLLIIFGAISGYLYNKFSAFAEMDFTPPPVVVASEVARAETWGSTLAAVGTLKAARGIELSAETSGEVVSIAVVSGQEVSEGQLLLSLNDRVEQASSEALRSNLELARILYERDARLVEQKSIPQSQYDRSKADYDSAVARLAENEARLELKRIHAPFPGTVGIIRVKPGDYINPGDDITTLQDLGTLEVDFTVPARYYPKLRPGQSIAVYVAAFPDRVFSATLQAIDSRVDAASRNLLLRAALLDAKGLLPGMFASLNIDLDGKQILVTVPETAITYSLHGDTVFVVVDSAEGKHVDSRIVETADSRDGRVGILSGVTAGEEVVIAGQNKLYKGAAVVIDESVDLP